MQPQEFPQFNQRTTWDGNADMLIKGADLQVIMDLANIFRPLVMMADRVMQKQILDQKVQVEYTGTNGEVIDPALVNQAIEAIQKRPQPSVS